MNARDFHGSNQTLPTRIIFFGTPDYAVPSLRALHADGRYDVSLVVTQPDRPAGRKRLLTAPAVKIAAEVLGLQVYQPESLRSLESRQPLIDVGADIFVVAAYGLIFGKKTLAIPRIGSVNLHASLLPQYRGASPVAAAILAGEHESGVTLMLMDAGIDTGAILETTRVPIAPLDTTASLTAKLAEEGAGLLVSHLQRFVAGDVQPAPQPAHGASLTRMLTKEDGRIDWNEPAEAIERQVRAMWDWPRAWTSAGEGQLQVHRAALVTEVSGREAGEIAVRDAQAVVTCGNGGLALDVVQPAGGKAMSGAAWIAGLRGKLPRLGGNEPSEPRQPLIVDV